MKRLVFCFDGTWNTLDAQHATNVVLTAESVLPLASDGTAQLIFYTEGVGTARFERLTGGMFGAGLVSNMLDGYRFLILNYTPGDEIYVFGFSRGAYTARSFVGLLKTAGIMRRAYASKAKEAISLYQRRDTFDDFGEDARRFRLQYSPDVHITADEPDWRASNGAKDIASTLLSVRYLGVWDTVGALGIPSRIPFSNIFDKKYRFHDTALTPFVASARHAVAIDERRKDFVPTLWDNISDLNKSSGADPSSADAPYQQQWFPGVHSSVGGGGERRGLSDQALDWVLDGARAAGLVLDPQDASRIFELKPDYKEYLDCSTTSSLYYKISNAIAAEDRLPGPSTLNEVGISAQRRWLEKPEYLKDQKIYRPRTLGRVEGTLDRLDPAQFGLGQNALGNSEFRMYQVQKGDQLRAIAKAQLGSADRAREIYELNRDKLDNPNRIYPGQMLRLPKE